MSATALCWSSRLKSLRWRPSTSYLVGLPIAGLLVGAAIHATVVPGQYEWFGLLRILRDVSHRRGFWVICLLVWGIGLSFAPLARTPVGAAKGAWAGWALVSTGLLVVIRAWPALIRAGSVYDEVACAACVPGLALHLVSTPGDCKRRFAQAAASLGSACTIFVGCSLVAYGHTMAKAALFLLAAPVDDVLMRLDCQLLGADFYERVSRFCHLHTTFVTTLDVAYIELFDQLWWSFLFFFGARDRRTARTYLLATFLVYLTGPICYFIAPSYGPQFHRPDLFEHLSMAAPDSARLARFLSFETMMSRTQQSHLIAPFGMIAAFPSLHVSLSLLVFLALRRSIVLSIINGIGVLLTLVATVLLGWHYVVDGAFGALLGIGCWCLAVRVTGRDWTGQAEGSGWGSEYGKRHHCADQWLGKRRHGRRTAGRCRVP